MPQELTTKTIKDLFNFYHWQGHHIPHLRYNCVLPLFHLNVFEFHLNIETFLCKENFSHSRDYGIYQDDVNCCEKKIFLAKKRSGSGDIFSVQVLIDW